MARDRIKKLPFTVVMLGMVSLFTDIASEMIYPLLPVFIGVLGSGAIVLGIVEGVAETTASVIKLLSGIISDRTGKRKLLVLIGYSVSSFIRPLTGIVSSAWQIIIIRMTDRAGKGIRTSPRDAIIASSVDESSRGRAFGFHRAMDHAGAVIGPILAISVLVILIGGLRISDPVKALRLTFILAAVPGLLAVLTIVFFIRVSDHQKAGNSAFSFNMREFDGNFRSYLIAVTLFTLGNSSDAFLLFRIEEAIRDSGALTEIISKSGVLSRVVSGLGTEENRSMIINILFLPFIWSFFHIIKVIMSTPLGALSDRIGRKVVIKSGWAVYAFVYICFALIVFLPGNFQVAASFILFAIYAFYYAFTEGTEKAFVADLADENKRGTAYGLYNFCVGLGALPASIIFGLLYTFADRLLPGYGGTVAFGYGAVMAIAAMIFLSSRVREERKA